MSFFIKSVEYYLPEKIIDNDFLQDFCGIERTFLEDKIGIKERRAASEDEKTSDLAYKAAKKVIESNEIEKDDIGFLIVCTQNPDYRLPGVAGIIQHRIGLSNDVFGFDVNLGCSGFVYSLFIMGKLVESNKEKLGLLITVDEYTKTIDYKDRATAGLFGDAATASIISICEGGFGFIDGNFGTDGSGYEKLILPNSSIVKEENSAEYLYMDGREIFKFSMKTVPKSINYLMKKNNIEKEMIKYYIFHQANKYMLKELQKRIQLDDLQMVIDMEMYGNTVSSTIPIAYKNLLNNKKIQQGDLLIFSGFGVGLSWGSVLYKYKK